MADRNPAPGATPAPSVYAPQATLVTGGVACGKTELLVQRAVALLEGGAKPGELLVLCASPTAALEFGRRLQGAATAAGVAGAEGVEALTPHQAALQVLADEEAVAWTGREPRVLTTCEEAILAEDMKVSGIKNRRLREMQGFFHRCWTELADDDPDWLITDEEVRIHTLLKGNLAFLRAYQPAEVGPFAVRYLRQNEHARATHARKHVLADDFTRMNRASQLLASLLAAESITVAGDPCACIETHDPHPYAAGLEEFAEANPNLERIELSQAHCATAVAQRVQPLLARKGMPRLSWQPAPGVRAGSVQTIAGTDAGDEVAQVAQAVAAALEGGLAPESIVIAVPNDTWAANIARALRALGVACAALSAQPPVRGNVHKLAACAPARLLTALDLVADPQCALAWRCWCGYGDPLARSAAFIGLRTWAQERGLGLASALELAAGTQGHAPEGLADAPGLQQVVECYREGRALIEKVQGLRGRALLDALAGAVGGRAAAPAGGVAPSLARLCLAKGQDDSAAAMAARARSRQLCRGAAAGGAVRIVPYDQICGLSPQLLVVTGFVNGFIPRHSYFEADSVDPAKRVHELERSTRSAYTLAGKAQEKLVVSWFNSMELDAASRLDLKIERIGLRDGVRTCTIAPSELLSIMQDNDC